MARDQGAGDVRPKLEPLNKKPRREPGLIEVCVLRSGGRRAGGVWGIRPNGVL